MILEEYCEVILSLKNREYYKLKGYDISQSKLIIKTCDLIPGSHKKIKVGCDICGNEKYIQWRDYLISFNNGNFYACSAKCAHSKNRMTCLKNHGVDNPSKSDKILKRKEDNNLAKYGSRYTITLDNVIDKIKKTNIDRYGVDNPTKSKIIYKKVRNTMKDKFGDEVIFKTDHFRENKNNYYRRLSNPDFFKNRKDQLLNYGIDLIDIDCNNYIIRCDKGHNYVVNNDILSKRIFKYNTNPCIICNKISSGSSIEEDFYEYILSIYDGEIIRNSRKIINPYEIDIYLPDKKIAFEFNGIYWHNFDNRGDSYHKIKYEKCFNNDIQLIQIWEDDWRFKKDIVKSIIKNKLNITDNKIWARNTKIIIFNDNNKTKKFLNDNHLQGDCKSNIKIGLEYNGDLVSLMTFSKNRYGVGKIKNDSFELTRFCNKLDHVVIGGASKILKFFKDNYKWNDIFSFSDCDISTGNLYRKLGFNYLYNTKPTYYYIVNGKRDHRFKWRKSILIKNNLLLENETEKGCMTRLKYKRIYNSGNKKWILIK